MYVKICGLRVAAHAELAVAKGADAVGVVMNATSSRRATEEEAAAVVGAAAGRVDTVLVVNDMPAVDAAAVAARLGFDVLQLHGSRYRADDFAQAGQVVPRLWRATSVKDGVVPEVGEYGEELLLLDAPRPGSGERWDLTALTDRAPQGRWLLAGGLSPENVGEAVASARPWGVDVSSGVECAPGEKDPDLITAFLNAVRSSER